MQYGVNIFPYERIKKSNKDTNNRKAFHYSTSLKLVVYFIAAFFISRVLMVNSMAPFGIAFLLCFILENKNIFLLSALGTLVGYLSIYNNVKDIGVYLCSIIVITMLSYISNKIKSDKKIIIAFILLFFNVALYGKVILNITSSIALLNAIIQTAILFPIYYIMKFSIVCIKELKTKHLYNSEEIISMAVTASLIISGTWGINIYGVSLRNILALSFILVVGYVKGSSAGASCGIAIGTIIGLSTNNMVAFTGMCGLCGLTAGVFKQMGKIASGIPYMVVFLILKLYSDIGIQFQFQEALISLAVFYVIPSKIYNRLELELDWERKQENLKENYISKTKEIFNSKLTDFSGLLMDMSTTLAGLADNDKLQMKVKSSALVENLADRVCSNCNMKSMCWKRESFYTYSAFVELIDNYQNKREKVPYEIERKCIKRSLLIKNTEEIVKSYIVNEMWRKRLAECREFLSNQIGNISVAVNEIVEEIDSSTQFNKYMENDITRVLNKNHIKFKDVFCYNDNDGRVLVNMTMDACGGTQKCVKDILPLINSITGKIMSVSDDGCNINPKDNTCNFTLEETPKFHVASYVSRLCKDGEKHNGDSYLYQKVNNGTYLTMISDGMGSGPQAGKESSAAVDLINKFVKLGFNKLTAINTINSLMTINFSQDEKFSTVDLNTIDLYTGEAEFIKVGAAATLIKSENKIETMDCKSLPIGVLEKVDTEIIKKQVKNGDMIIMVSDGVLDYDNEEAGKSDWLVEYLSKDNTNDPEILSNNIIKRAKELSKGKIKDDMTVVVSKVYNLY
ncbi:stage II sporulation protein E [Clostridium sp. BSD9I1]|uniref:stage II sporulation protein E n=1 Tax=Clostridium sp. BSD9I1 TaxID=2003589 RepID=UPI001644FFA4|nr:stage II sporulation protein E [Clostridium sp. BSD9I1]